MKLERTGFSIFLKNFWLLGMFAAYLVLSFSSSTLNPHARTVISQFIVFSLPGFLVYKLWFAEHSDDLYEKIVFSFLLSCFVFLVIGTIGYFFKLSLALSMNALLIFFILSVSFILSRDEPGSCENSFISFFVLAATGILAYAAASAGPNPADDSLFHIANIVKISNSGIITPDGPFSKGIGPDIKYFYCHFYVILAVIKKLSLTGPLVVWYHLPKVILFFAPLCYYTLAKTIFKDKRAAYFACFFVIGMIIAGYYKRSIGHPYPRRFNHEILIPIFYITFIRYFQSHKIKNLVLLVISTMVIIMFHPSGAPFIFFNGILYLSMLLFFKDGFKNIKSRISAFIFIAVANIPYLLSIKLGFPNKLIGRMKSGYPGALTKMVTKNMFIIDMEPFFSVDNLICCLVLLCMVIASGCSELTLIMLASFMVIPVFLFFPPFATFFSKLFTPNMLKRMHDIPIRPLFFIFFLIIISFYAVKLLERNKKYNFFIFLPILINSYLIHKYFWVPQIGMDVVALFACVKLERFHSIFLGLTALLLPLYYYTNKGKCLVSVQNPSACKFFSKDSRFLLILFIPLLINTVFLLHKKIDSMSFESRVFYHNPNKLILNKDYIPGHLQYISSHEKPRSVIVLTEDGIESQEVSLFIPQFIFNSPRLALTNASLSLEEVKRLQETSKKIYDDNFSIDKTLNFIYDDQIDYIVDHHSKGHKKFGENEKNFRLVYIDKEVSLYYVNRVRK